VKETLGIDARFLLGDFVPFVTQTGERFDAVIASGVLYHMERPVELLKGLARISDNILIWTHYFDRDLIWRQPHVRRRFPDNPAITDGVELWRYDYLEALQSGGFCGGPLPFSMWMTKPGMLGVLRNCGFDVTSTMDQPAHPNGPSILLYARRRGTS
jgi:hypothetical protein